jgi:hypothetical protein
LTEPHGVVVAGAMSVPPLTQPQDITVERDRGVVVRDRDHEPQLPGPWRLALPVVPVHPHHVVRGLQLRGVLLVLWGDWQLYEDQLGSHLGWPNPQQSWRNAFGISPRCRSSSQDVDVSPA